MSFAGLSAFANTSIARTPEPSATVNGPFGVSQPASCGGSDPLRGVVLGGPRPGRRRGVGRAVAVDEVLAGEHRAALGVDEDAIGGRLDPGRVDDEGLERRDVATGQRRERDLTRALDVGEAGDVQAVPAARQAELARADAGDARQRRVVADVDRGPLPRLGVGQLRRAAGGERLVTADRRRGGHDLPRASGLRDADRHEAAAGRGEAAGGLAERDRMRVARGEPRVGHLRDARERGEAEQRAVAVQPGPGGVARRRAAGRAERAAGAHERRWRPELVPRDLGAHRLRVGALGRRRGDVAAADVEVRQAG
jgi:hypothetical protein